jgi:hypothetical protein
VPGLQVLKRADRNKDPQEAQGSVVGIQNRGWKMYTGTLISDLMATVERAERGALQKKIVDELELQRLFELQVPQMLSEPILAGAA